MFVFVQEEREERERRDLNQRKVSSKYFIIFNEAKSDLHNIKGTLFIENNL